MLYNGSESCFYGSKRVNNNNIQPAVISVKIPEIFFQNFPVCGNKCMEAESEVII